MSDLFIPNQIIKRSTIHDQYGGNRQSGISPSAKFPYIFIFTGTSGHQYGYKDNWDNENVFAYTGEGQNGDMKFESGNLALRDHLLNGKKIFLFESATERSFVRYVCELEFFDADIYNTPDKTGETREGIRLFFKRKDVILTYDLKDLPKVEEPLVKYTIPDITERKGLITTRVGQGVYRKSIVNRWEGQCAVTGFNDLRILIASHIHPWKESDNQQRLDIHNGILLSPTYDALFDKNLISFEHNGKIVLSDSIEFSAYEKIGVTGKEQIKGFNSDNHFYLAKHQELLLKRS